MSKTKQREHSETEYLKGQIRKLESENRQLKKRLKKLDRRAHFYENIVEESVEEVEVKDKCPSCKKGDLVLIDLKYVQFEQCNEEDCDYRKKL